MCYRIKLQKDEKVLRKVPVSAFTTEEAKDIFQHDFPGVNHFELISP
jgi:hypothetical protein